MGRALRTVLKWLVLTAVAVGLGSAIGAAYALNLQEPEEALAPHPLEEPAGGKAVEPAPERDLAAPPAPALVAPRDGAYVSWQPKLVWEAVADASNVIYAIELSTDPGFPKETTQVVRNLQGTEWRPERPFSPLVEVHWRVRALDAGLNEGPWSDAWSFTPALPAGDAEVVVDLGPEP